MYHFVLWLFSRFSFYLWFLAVLLWCAKMWFSLYLSCFRFIELPEYVNLSKNLENFMPLFFKYFFQLHSLFPILMELWLHLCFWYCPTGCPVIASVLWFFKPLDYKFILSFSIPIWYRLGLGLSLKSHLKKQKEREKLMQYHFLLPSPDSHQFLLGFGYKIVVFIFCSEFIIVTYRRVSCRSYSAIPEAAPPHIL